MRPNLHVHCPKHGAQPVLLDLTTDRHDCAGCIFDANHAALDPLSPAATATLYPYRGVRVRGCLGYLFLFCLAIGVVGLVLWPLLLASA